MYQGDMNLADQFLNFQGESPIDTNKTNCQICNLIFVV